MTISTKEEKQSKLDKKENSQKKPTPWQEAHQKYLEEKRLMDKILKKNQEQEESESLAEPSEEVEQQEKNERPMIEILSSEKSTERTRENISFSDKLPKMKDYRQRKLYRRLALIISLFLIPLVGCIYYISPLGQLAKVDVIHNQQVPSEQIVKTANFKINEPLWEQYFSRQSAIQKIQKISPWIKAVNVKIVHFNQFQINVTEYHRVAYLLTGDKYYDILENGQVLKNPITQDQLQSGLPILEGFTSKKLILKTLKAYHKLPEEFKQSISQIKSTPRAENDQLLTLNMNDQNQVLINIDQLTKKLPYYAKVASNMQEPGIVDMEVGLFTYPYPKEEKKTGDSSEKISDSDSENSESVQENPQA
ncbi:cell division protein FtsQ/DivIB [Enterococcus cecorum]|uniref:cell division protein FtsQ/DivIB n=1 Tax=Enterococcus cecorum TaxID=44008 RepID=UPI000ADB52B0|nr:cell division protein FtsQ/DivIB [Enterococcus cecorum]CAI3398532.1 cell division protein FtsQ/DivIB [Enterococcus cecorum]CAI3438088.1 cell division protein FtsQ/DivIB [Enterococcus cecorum]